MTKHKSKEERVEEILEAAAEEVDRGGLAGLTMEAIAARTALSKAGVYRFFPNKRAVALALFTRLYRRFLEPGLTVGDIVGWNLPIPETIVKLIFWQTALGTTEREQRIWVQLLPETLRDPDFRAERARLLEEARQKVVLLIGLLVARDAIAVGEDFAERLDAAIATGISLMEGLLVQGSAGTPIAAQIEMTKRFVEAMFHEVLCKHDDENAIA